MRDENHKDPPAPYERLDIREPYPPPYTTADLGKAWAGMPIKMNGAGLASFIVVYFNAFTSSPTPNLPIIPGWLFGVGLLLAFYNQVFQGMTDRFYRQFDDIAVRLDFIARVNQHPLPSFHDQMKKEEFKKQIEEIKDGSIKEEKAESFRTYAVLTSTYSKYCFIAAVIYSLVWITL